MKTRFSRLACASPTAVVTVAGEGARAGCPALAASSKIRIFLELTKIRITVLSTLSAATGYIVFARTVNLGLVTACFGVILLAMGACAINQVQDCVLDARMTRTRSRPIPAGLIRPAPALGMAVMLSAAGFVELWLMHNAAAALIGLAALAWYNGVYTYLKRIWAFAVVPGALIGALPPAIGWTAAGGRALDLHLLALCFFFFIWQVPHFWLLLFSFGSDYERAGLPSLTKLFSRRQLAGLTFVWMLATFASSLLLALYRLTDSPWVELGLVGCGLWLSWEAVRFKRAVPGAGSMMPAFRAINLYALFIMVLLVVNAVL